MEKAIDFLVLYEEIFRILSKENIQEFMDTCYEIVGVPILVVDVMYNLLGIAPNEKTNDYYWDYLLEKRGYGTEMVAQLYEDRIMQSVNEMTAPYVVDWGSCKDYPKIQGIIKINDIVEGYVTMNCTYEEITPDRLKAMKIIMEACALFFKNSSSQNSMTDTHQKVFIGELLNNRIQTKKQLEIWENDMDCKLTSGYQLLSLSTKDRKEKNVLSYIRKLHLQFSPYQFSLIQENILYILFYKVHSNLDILSNQNFLHKIFMKFNVHCGVSNHFDNLLEVSSYQKQAVDAMHFGAIIEHHTTIHFYSNLYIPAILMPRLLEMPKCNYISPIIPLIEAYDREYSSEFFMTLRCYIRNQCSTTATSKELHTHRNTILYRINKIEELFNVSLRHTDTFAHLLISFYMYDLEQVK